MMRRAVSHTHINITALPACRSGRPVFGSTLGMNIDRRVQVPNASLMAGTLGIKAGVSVLLPCVHTDMYIYAG